MLKVISLDLVRLTLPIEAVWFSVLVERLCFIHEEFGHGVKKQMKPHKLWWTLWMKIGKERLTIDVSCACGHMWIEYKFKGEINYQAFQDQLVVLEKFGLANALVYGRVKRLELALDIYGPHTKDFHFHCSGMHTGHVVSNAIGDGFTHYVGSQFGHMQFVSYDKKQQLKDAGLPHPKGDMLRIELRVLKSPHSLVDLLGQWIKKNPFDKLYMVSKSLLIEKHPQLKHWKMLLQHCSEVGVPTALKSFPQHKKTLLNDFKKYNAVHLLPTFETFEEVFSRVMGSALALEVAH